MARRGQRGAHKIINAKWSKMRTRRRNFPLIHAFAAQKHFAICQTTSSFIVAKSSPGGTAQALSSELAFGRKLVSSSPGRDIDKDRQQTAACLLTWRQVGERCFEF
jgi:hypothetical protein